MSEIDGLLQQKNDLLKQINQINASSENIDKILNAIKNQRWFYFEGKPKVIFDRNTNLLWADLNYFPYSKGGNVRPYLYYLSEIRELITSTNLKGIDGYTAWQIPTPSELWNLVEDETFKYIEGGTWRIKKVDRYCVYFNGKYQAKDLDDYGEYIDIRDDVNCCVIPCNHKLVSKDNSKSTLDIFVENNLIPSFNDESIVILYKQIFINRATLLKQLADVQAKIDSLQKVIFISSNFNFEEILINYDISAIDRSIFKYIAAVKSLAETFLDKIEIYEAEKRNIINECTAITSELNDIRLARLLKLDMDYVKFSICSLKTQTETIEEQIEKINLSDHSLIGLAEIESKPRASFNFIAENLGNLVKNALLKIEFYEAHSDFVKYVVEAWQNWNNSYNDAANKLKDNSDWKRRRDLIEGRFVPMVEIAFKGNLFNAEGKSAAKIALDILSNYKQNVDNLYLGHNSNIEEEFYNLTDKLQKNMQEVIDSRTKSEEKILLTKWLAPLLKEIRDH